MCGIAGIIGPFDQASGEAMLKKMLHVIEHRGPDSNGLWATDNFAFGMQRLSIIDLAGGDQPIWSDEGVGIVFNGEIYNFKKIRIALEQDGIKFNTHSDTEVILQLYLRRGIEAIHDLEGMFGICLYDPRVRKVFLIRDRLGVKPVYYYYKDDTFIFASEIKSIIAALPKELSINENSIWDYLTLRYVPSPDTIWDDISKLEPAHFIEYDLNHKKFDILKYWSVDFHSTKIQKHRNYEKEFETLFLEAVEKRLLASDVPVGVLLSGGLDSSCVVAAAVELGHENFHTFSIGFEDPDAFNELPYAAQVAKHLGSQHHETIITQKQFLDFLEDFTYFADEPMADLASIPLYYVSKLAVKDVKVVLSGEGADEVLAGYNIDTTAKHLQSLKFFSYLPKPILELIGKLKPSIKILSQYGYSNFLKNQSVHITDVFRDNQKNIFWKKNKHVSTQEKIRSWYDLSTSLEPIDQLQQAYCQSWLVEDLLMKADKMTMANSLELRVPFLDHKLVEWASKLPLDWKVGNLKEGFTTKRILRNFAQKRLPKNIIERPKQGFPVPAYIWMQTNLHLWAQKIINDSSLNKYINTVEIKNLLNNTSKESTHQLWSLVILAIWLKKWAS